MLSHLCILENGGEEEGWEVYDYSDLVSKHGKSNCYSSVSNEVIIHVTPNESFVGY